MLVRWLTISYLAERWKRKEEESERVVTDAQGLPFRCVVLVVACVITFFGTATVLSVERRGGEFVGEGVSRWTLVTLGIMAALLIAQMSRIAGETVTKARAESRARQRSEETGLREPLVDVSDLSTDSPG